MFQYMLVWLKGYFYWWTKKTPVVVRPPRLDEFHEATYQELFNAAWLVVNKKAPPKGRKEFLAYLHELEDVWPTEGAKIEFNDEGLGRVVTIKNGNGRIEIGMANLPVKVRWNPTGMCLRVNEAQSREFFVRLMDGTIPGQPASGVEPLAQTKGECNEYKFIDSGSGPEQQAEVRWDEPRKG